MDEQQCDLVYGAIIQLLKRNKLPPTPDELAKETGIRRWRVRRYLRRLHQQERIKLLPGQRGIIIPGAEYYLPGEIPQMLEMLQQALTATNNAHQMLVKRMNELESRTGLLSDAQIGELVTSNMRGQQAISNMTSWINQVTAVSARYGWSQYEGPLLDWLAQKLAVTHFYSRN